MITILLSFKSLEVLSCRTQSFSHYLNLIKFLNICNSAASISLEKHRNFPVFMPKIVSVCL